MYKSMQETMKKALMEKDKECYEIKGPFEAPDEWKLFKNDPPTGDIDHFYVSFAKKGTEESIVFDACLHGQKVVFIDDRVFEIYVRYLFGDNIEVYWKKAEAKEETK